MTTLVLLIVACVLLALDAVGVTLPRVKLLPAGLALWVLALLLQGHTP